MKTKNDLSRITIDIPKKNHKKLKTMAVFLGKSMRQLVIESIERYLLKQPNRKTLKAIKAVEKNKGLVNVKDTEDLFRKLDM